MSANPGWAFGYVPTAAEWNGLWAQKCDATDSRLTGALQASNNLSDLTNPAAARTALGLSAYALLASPALTGTPTAPTAAAGTATPQIATCAFVSAAVAAATAGVSSLNGRTGAVTLTSSDVTSALSFTPYNSSNPAGYITSSGAPVQTVAGRTGAVTLAVGDVTGAAPKASPLFTGTVTLPAGTTSVQPMKFQSGSLLSIPVAHSVEWDGSALYLTNSSGTRATVASQSWVQGLGYQTAAQVSAALPAASTTTPSMDGTTATVGTGTTFARADHSHPSDSPAVSTVAALRSATTTTLPASRCVLLGYASTADGGQGTFLVKSSDTTSSDNGGTTIVDASGRRWVRDASSLSPSVLWFGAKGDGGTDAVTAFEAAAAVAADVSIPSGSYHLSRRPDVHGKNIMWHLAQDATIVEGAGYLNGGLIRPNRVNRQTWGTFNEGAVFAVSGLAGDTPAGVEGFTTDSQQASYTTRDGVAFYSDNAVPPPVLTSSGAVTYTSTTCTSAAAADVTKLLVDMFVITKHSPFYSGRLVSWSGDGKTFTVSGWYAQGNTASGQVPANGTSFDVIRGSAAWAANYNIFLSPDSYNGAGGPLGVGLEIGTWQNYAPFNPATQLPNMSGIDVVELGTYGSNNAYLQRGQHYYGYASAGARFSSFYIYDNASLANGPYAAPTYGFCCQAICAPFAYLPGGVLTWLVGSNGQMDIGNTSTGGQVGIDLHVLPDNPAAPRDYDIRIEGIANGSGGADLFVQGASALHTPGIVPNTSGNLNLGGPSAVWGNAWLTNINLLGGLTAATTVSAGGDITSSGGSLIVANNVQAGTGASGGGYLCRAGKTGAFGTNDFNLYWTGSQMQLWVDTTSLGVITTTSDARYKTDITPTTDSGLDRVLQMKPVSFRYADKGIFRDDGVTREGFLAQDLLSVVPSSVENSTTPDQPMSVNPVPLISVLVKAVQEMAARIEVLEAALNLPGARANGGSL